MKIARLAADSFRRFDKLGFEPHAHVSVLRGANASGKTSVLEAIYIASRAASFRARRLDEIPTEGRIESRVQLVVVPYPDQPPTHWTAIVSKDQITVQQSRELASRRQLTQSIPLVMVDRQLHRVIEEGPLYRRRYLDWGLFYVEPPFFDLWRRHERVLRQRNQALRQRTAASEIKAWDPEFIASALGLHRLRVKHVADLQTAAKSWIARLLHTENFEFILSAGWNEQLGLQESLDAGLAGDRKMGFTHAGPSRAELRVRFEGREAKAFVSRGQQKLLAVAMALAQAELVGEITGRAPIILLDDLEAELAVDWQKRLIKALFEYPGQSIVTSLEWSEALLPAGFEREDYGMFHVEHGAVTPSEPH